MAPLKILVIEDDLILAEELGEQLVEFGYLVTDIVSNSYEAIKAFKKRLPDLVVCDIQLKGSKIDGIDLALELKKLARTPLIFLTAFGDNKTTERAKAVNPAYYLIKPCNSTQLQIAIEFALSNFSQNLKADFEHSLKSTPLPICQLYSKEDYFFVRNNLTFQKVEISEILYVKGESPGNNIRILTENESFFHSAGLKSFSKQVSHKSLVRIHRSYLININKVVAFDSGRVFVMQKGEKINLPIGITYREKFQDFFLKLRSD